MKRLFALAILVSLVGCKSMYPVKKTEFYKNHQLVKTFIGRGIWAQDNDTYRIWCPTTWCSYVYECRNCEVVEGQ